ncbi:MAG: transketolase [Planktomarina sp.]|nr:transketolase [Planktomarina sp.]
MPKNFSHIRLKELRHVASALRFSTIKMSNAAKSAHLGSCLSCMDILVALYFDILNVDPSNPKDRDRDIFIMSKGHAAMALYAVLSKRGFFDERNLEQFNIDGSMLAEHPPAKGVPGVEAATGSLGHGLPIAAGQALGMKLNSKGSDTKNRVYALLSDGENNEGSVWEAAMFASSNKLNNLTVFIDYNKWQATGRSDEIMNGSALVDRWKAFGWETHYINGHDMLEILNAGSIRSDVPVAIIADTVKGKGVSFMEDDNNWHYRIPNMAEVAQAREELGV